eukprot:CAMPEP_0183731112 /NCGR_PEP_ID=MMETSP0737-20130205/34470_1 /TAXON_ID=385413 /ORGANISM="Thalassiosira miniscula, Strain CCMP1093" /LENGTH=520 /DNA_ID=CAMNT_0025963771 /DNA_START=20 /DNA_END=1579 /DNA_ORIENTATION=+
MAAVSSSYKKNLLITPFTMAATISITILFAIGIACVEAFGIGITNRKHSLQSTHVQRVSRTIDTMASVFRPLVSSRKPELKLMATSATTNNAIDSQHTETKNKIQLELKTWMFRNKFPIAYEVAKSTKNANSNADDVEIVPILLLNGFGVGSFHQHSLMRQLLLLQQQQDEENERSSSSKREYVIYGIDYLGQGKSWPSNCNDGDSEDELDLGYSADMWLDQLQGFIEEVILPSSTSNSDNAEKKVHLVGNSVGGYLSTILTSRIPTKISSLTLMNATPVWGLNLPGWNGRLPAPPLPKIVGRTLFDVIRDLDTIDKYLEAAYVRREAFDGTYDDGFHRECDGSVGASTTLGQKIRGCTMGKGGHAAFASILWSAPASEFDGEKLTSTPADFYGTLETLPVDVLLLFGADDPWCTPAVAKRMHTTLTDGGENDENDGGRRNASWAQRYISIQNVGHCPNHEAPHAVARVLSSWIDASSGRNEAPLVFDNDQINEPWGVVGLREVSIEESRDLGLMDKIVS